MAALDFKNRSAVLDYLTTALPAADEDALEALLDASAGESCADPPITVYRPFWVQATLQAQTLNEIASATGASGASVTYRDNRAAVRSFMRQQAALDKSLCSVPEGFEATGGGSVRMRTVF